MGRKVLVSVLLVVASVVPAVAAGGAETPPTDGPVPTVRPAAGGAGRANLVSTSFDLAAFGYVQEEFVVSGTATAYSAPTPLPSDGRWSATPATTAPFVTRLVVVRPDRARDFSGTVFQEWLNVSAGFDSAPGWTLAHLEILRSGAAWVGVSAQAVGVQGGQSTVAGIQAGGLRGADPDRYADLTHPGDSYSYDIFTQSGRAVREAGVLGPLRPRRLIATGESQSATRLVTYADAVQPLTREFDGFLIHSRFGGAAALSQVPLPVITAPVPTFVRSDLGVPVLQFETETDVGRLGFAVARQDDTKRLRTWEVAGTAHADAYTGAVGFGDVGDGRAEAALLDYANPSRGPLNCATPVNAGPHWMVLMAAYRHLDAWTRDGTLPPRSPRFAGSEGPPASMGAPGSPPVPTFVIERDADGIAVGGIRTPLVDAPRATMTGEANEGGSFCALFGRTVPFTAAQVTTKYPTAADYVRAFTAAGRRAVRQGYLLAPDARRLQDAAAATAFPGVG